MTSDIIFARLCADAYLTPFTWERNDVHATLRKVDGLNVVTFMGSKNLIDFWRDIQVIGDDGFNHPELGPVHSAFYRDVDEIFHEIQATLGDEPAWFNGHSKGGGEAQIAAARRKLSGKPVAGISTYGAPRIGRLNGLILGYPGFDNINAQDPVPDFPTWLPHPRDTRTVGSFTLRDILNPISDHFIASYEAVVDKR